MYGGYTHIDGYDFFYDFVFFSTQIQRNMEKNGAERLREKIINSNFEIVG